MLLPEVIDHIFSFLRGDRDISALNACSRAHPLFSRLAERHLYADIIVETYNPQAISELYKRLSNNSRILDYARTLEIRTGNLTGTPPLEALSFMPMIPRMTNLMSLTICDQPFAIDVYKHFLSTFRNCLQQSSVKEVCLHNFSNFPLSILDNGKSIKKLMLSDCRAAEEPMSIPDQPYQPLETLIIIGDHNSDLLSWATCRIAHLRTLELRFALVGYEWTAFSELLTACSNSNCLRRLHLDVGYHCQSTLFCPNNHHHVGSWIDDDLEFPFTLSTLMSLKELSIFALMDSDPTTSQIRCAFPAIVRLIRTLPPLQALVLSFYCDVPDVVSLTQLDWSPLDRSLTDFADVCPHIELRISGEGTDDLFSPESILDALAENEALMGLVKRDVVILKPELIDKLLWGKGEGWPGAF